MPGLSVRKAFPLYEDVPDIERWRPDVVALLTSSTAKVGSHFALGAPGWYISNNDRLPFVKTSCGIVTALNHRLGNATVPF